MPRISKEQLIQFNKKYAYLIDDIQDFAISYVASTNVAKVQPANVKWIYAALVTHCRKQGWIQPFLISDEQLSRTTSISRRGTTLEKARQILKAWGKLDYLETPMGVFYTFDPKRPIATGANVAGATSFSTDLVARATDFTSTSTTTQQQLNNTSDTTQIQVNNTSTTPQQQLNATSATSQRDLNNTSDTTQIQVNCKSSQGRNSEEQAIEADLTDKNELSEKSKTNTLSEKNHQKNGATIQSNTIQYNTFQFSPSIPQTPLQKNDEKTNKNLSEENDRQTDGQKIKKKESFSAQAGSSDSYVSETSVSDEKHRIKLKMFTQGELYKELKHKYGVDTMAAAYSKISYQAEKQNRPDLLYNPKYWEKTTADIWDNLKEVKGIFDKPKHEEKPAAEQNYYGSPGGFAVKSSPDSIITTKIQESILATNSDLIRDRFWVAGEIIQWQLEKLPEYPNISVSTAPIPKIEENAKKALRYFEKKGWYDPDYFKFEESGEIEAIREEIFA